MNKPEIPQEALEQMQKEGWATPAEQMAYWEKHDHGGNVLEDRIEANTERYSKSDAIEDAKLESRIEAHEDYQDQREYENE